MPSPYQFGAIPDPNDPSKTVLYFKQDTVEHSKDITGVPLPEDPQERFTVTHTMIYEEGWVDSNDAFLVQQAPK